MLQWFNVNCRVASSSSDLVLQILPLVLSVLSIQMCLCTRSLIFTGRRRVSHLYPTSLSQTGPSSPCLSSHSLSLSFSLSLFFQHLRWGLYLRLVTPQQEVVCNYRAEWADWWGDCTLLTDVLCGLKTYSPTGKLGPGDKPRWAQTTVWWTSPHRMQHSPSITFSQSPPITLPSCPEGFILRRNCLHWSLFQTFENTFKVLVDSNYGEIMHRFIITHHFCP